MDHQKYSTMSIFSLPLYCLDIVRYRYIVWILFVTVIIRYRYIVWLLFVTAIIHYRYIVWNNVQKFQENRANSFELRTSVWRWQGCGT